MLTKFESKSNRVKGLAFHSSRPWVLTSLHNGVIQLWDYRMGTLLDRFDEHDGPVRGVDFHAAQPLIVSGGDDYRIKVWDYKLRRCLFTLLGHLDYIRTVNFHKEYPWLVSASDDQTIRIWNWQSRSCVSVLTGHNHYVMCASFHPKDDLIVSASLDQTVRVWDISGLRKKTVRGAPSSASAAVAAGLLMGGGGGAHNTSPLGGGSSSSSSLHDLSAAAGGGGANSSSNNNSASSVVSRVNADLFGGNDAVVKYVLEGHDRGVNWASFHPTLPLVISGADDRQVKLWRMNETKAWEVDTMRGHSNNVSCVVFHPKHELIVSNSEDRSIRVWDISKRLGVQTFRRENDRFWILAAHPNQNLLAAGHDSGMLVFKLERERPAFATHGASMFYVKDKYLRVHDFQSGRDVPTLSLRRAGHGHNGLGHGPRALDYNVLNPSENNVLIYSDFDGGSYEFLSFAGDATATQVENINADAKRGPALAAVFLARNRFAILDKNRQILIKDLNNEKRKSVAPPHPGCDGMFFAGTSGRLLLRCDDRLLLFEPQSRRVLAEVQVARVKYVIWNKESTHVCLVSKHGLTIATRDLDQLCSVTETVRVKGGAWDGANPRIFVYTTLNHIKYCLPNGDTGIIRTLDVPVYVTKVQHKQVFCLDREGKTRTIAIDNTEALFKLALEDRNYPQVMQMVRHARLCGKAIIAYLEDKGFPEVALHFVDDLRTRFNLALACGNVEVAMKTAYDLGDNRAWHRLGVEAMRQGNHEVVEMAYQRTKNFERLSFLYLLTGNTDKLRKMLKIAEMRGDVMARFHNALFLGNVEDRVRVLEQSGQLYLALLTAQTHGLADDFDRLRQIAEAQGLDVALPQNNTPPGNGPAALLIQPPTPILRADNWPLLALPKSAMYDACTLQNTTTTTTTGGGGGGKYNAAAAMMSVGADAADGDYGDAGSPLEGAWGDDLDLGDNGPDSSGPGVSKRGTAADGPSGLDDEAGGWGDDLDLGDDLGLGLGLGAAGGGDAASAHHSGGGGGHKPATSRTAPTAGTPAASAWCAGSSHAADHVAAGSFETAMQYLNRQIAVADFTSLKATFMTVFAAASCSVPGLPLASALDSSLHRTAPADAGDGEATSSSLRLPAVAVKMGALIEDLKGAYRLFQKGQFQQAKGTFDALLRAIPFVVADSRAEANEARELLDIAREYVTALRLKQANATATGVRQVELAALFTHCNLQPQHLALALNLAMTQAFKGGQFIHAAGFARRLLDLPDVASMHAKAQAVLQKAEQKGSNDHEMNYDPRNPFDLDCANLRPLYRGTPSTRCSYCASAYEPTMKNKLCMTCEIALVGLETIGLITQAQVKRER